GSTRAAEALASPHCHQPHDAQSQPVTSRRELLPGASHLAAATKAARAIAYHRNRSGAFGASCSNAFAAACTIPSGGTRPSTQSGQSHSSNQSGRPIPEVSGPLLHIPVPSHVPHSVQPSSRRRSTRDASTLGSVSGS